MMIVCIRFLVHNKISICNFASLNIFGLFSYRCLLRCCFIYADTMVSHTLIPTAAFWTTLVMSTIQYVSVLEMQSTVTCAMLMLDP